jgi:hypothetical protein
LAEEFMMSLYSIALFLHIVAALGFFAGLGVEWTTVIQLRRATTAEQVGEYMNLSGSLQRVGMISMLTLVAAGIYMMAIAWGWIAWLIISFAAIILMMVLMRVISIPRMRGIQKAVSTEKGALSLELQEQLRQPMLWVGIQSRVIMGLGIVFLMTVKPDLGGSLITVGITIIISLVLAVPTLSQRGTSMSTMRKTS